MVTKNRSYTDFGDTGKLNFPYYRIISMFWQIFNGNVPKPTIFKDYFVYYFGIRLIERALKFKVVSASAVRHRMTILFTFDRFLVQIFIDI